MLKTKTVLGIDIGFMTLKLVEMEMSKKGPVLVNYAIAPIPDVAELDEKDIVGRNQKITALLKNILKDKKIKATSVALALSSRSIFTRFVKMPFSDPKKLEKLITFEAQQQIPFPLETVSWDYQIVCKNEDEEFEVLIAAIKQDTLNDHMDALKKTALTPMIIDVGAMALYNSIQSQIKPEEKIIILDLGATPATMILHQPSGYWVRTLSYSSMVLTQTLMRTFNISFEESESLKFSGMILNEATSKSSDNVNFKINQILTVHAQKLHTEIVRSLNFYRTQFKDIEFDRMILCGGGSRLDDLRAYLSAKLQLTVDFINPLLGIELDKKVEAKEIQDVAYLFGDAIGLALRQLQPCKVELNLMNVSTNIETAFKRYLKYYYAFCFILLIAFGFGIFSIEGKLRQLMVSQSEILNEHERLENLKTKITQETKQNKILEQEMLALSDVCQNRDFWIQFYLTLNRMVPPRIYLTRFISIPNYCAFPQRAGKTDFQESFDPSALQISLSGTAENPTILDQFKEKLLELDRVEKVEIVNATIEGEVAFELRIVLQKQKIPPS
jgi:type IV pilus assembly protein PilM